MSDLHDPRVLFAAERTLLAWNRTSLSLMAFGFVVERFGLFLNVLGKSGIILLEREISFYIGLKFDDYRELPAFEDVEDGLARLKGANFRLYAFSNGSADAVETLHITAGIRDSFLGVVSTDDLKSFKPNPAVYSHFLRKSESSGSNAWLISSNPFDVIGAISAGMKAAWVKRSRASIFDPWEIEPTITVKSLLELHEKFASYDFCLKPKFSGS
jgi:FMN phosphatase YigB (HAD superfamily)